MSVTTSASQEIAMASSSANPEASVPDLADWGQQCDEVLALAAIYGDAFRIVNGTGLPPHPTPDDLDRDVPVPDLEVAIEVPVELPGPRVRLQLLAAASEGEVGPSTARPVIGRVPSAATPLSPSSSAPLVPLRFLPPIEARATLGAGYPSTRAPTAHVAVEWGSEGAGERMEAALRDAWERVRGMPALHAWAEWLRESALEAAGVVDLGPAPLLQVVLGDGEDADDALRYLIEFSARKERQAFEDRTHECQLCGEDKPGAHFLQLPECRHAYCRACLTSLCSVHVKEGSLAMLRCPDPECKRPLPHYVLRDLLTDEEYQRWDELSLSRSLSVMGLQYCPRCNTAAEQEPGREKGVPLAQCPKCMLVFCCRCRLPDHVGESCPEAMYRAGADAEALEASMQGELAKLKLTAEQERERRRLASERRAEAGFRKYLKETEVRHLRCPVCTAVVFKSSGCNKMMCTACSTPFCFLCGSQISGYDHFNAEARTGSAQCAGRLFDQEEVNAWMAAQQWVQNNAQRRAPAVVRVPDRAYSNCVRCGQLTEKVANNNHMRCAACNSQWCYVCRAELRRRGTLHFGEPPKCRQHTPG